jgi:hypothetical protein
MQEFFEELQPIKNKIKKTKSKKYCLIINFPVKLIQKYMELLYFLLESLGGNPPIFPLKH